MFLKIITKQPTKIIKKKITTVKNKDHIKKEKNQKNMWKKENRRKRIYFLFIKYPWKFQTL